jgi:hypothetical protein
VCLGIFIIIVFGTFFLFPANVHYQVTERYTFSGPGETASVYLGVMLPNRGPYQSVGVKEINWDGMQQKESYGFVDTIKFSGEKTSQDDLEAVIEYDVQLPQGYVNWVAPVERFQRLPQAGIESDSESIQDQATLISSGMFERNAYRIYLFTADHLIYSQKSNDVVLANASALKAFENQCCSCLGYARLMTAFCRAANIPAQVVIGLIYPDPIYGAREISSQNEPCKCHAWVEYFSDGSWKLADPTLGASISKFMQFDRNDGRHLSYGELDQIITINEELVNWALERTEIVVGGNKSFRFIATSESEQISFIQDMSVRMVWDGRWLNTLIVWGVSTWLIYKYRDKIIGSPSQKSKSPSNF